MNFQKLKPTKHFISSVLIAIIIGLFVSAIFVLADWSAPSATPPTCPASDPACNTPLNVSSFSHTKSGALGVSGVFHAWGGATGQNDGLIVSNGSVGIGTTPYYPGGQYPYALTLPNNSSYNYGGGIAYKWDTYAGGKLCINGDCRTSWPTGTNYWTDSGAYVKPTSGDNVGATQYCDASGANCVGISAVLRNIEHKYNTRSVHPTLGANEAVIATCSSGKQAISGGCMCDSTSYHYYTIQNSYQYPPLSNPNQWACACYGVKNSPVASTYVDITAYANCAEVN